ncbi:MAG: hypothetical protein RL260_3845 [Pseudomonadota bacterium]|jgi:hypothetical protein
MNHANRPQQPTPASPPAGRTDRVRNHLLALEARMMFDGAALAAAVDALDFTHDGMPHGDHFAQETQAVIDLAEAMSGLAIAGRTLLAPVSHEIAFVDGGLRDAPQLIAGLDRSVEVVLLDAGRDGVDQIAQTLAGRRDLDAVHILSHGGAGALYLGTAVLNQSTLQGRYAADFRVIQAALSEQCDVLLHGCDVAVGPTGAAFLHALSLSTGADASASLRLPFSKGPVQESFWFETEVLCETLHLSVRPGHGRATGTDSRVAEYQFLTTEGRPLPAQIRADPHGQVTITRVPGLERVGLMVRALRADGAVTEARLEIDVSSGAVRLLAEPDPVVQAPASRQPSSAWKLSKEPEQRTATRGTERQAPAMAAN